LMNLKNKEKEKTITVEQKYTCLDIPQAYTLIFKTHCKLTF
jgi:hypothetical protein